MTDKEKMLVIVNPVSGLKKQKLAIRALERKIDRVNFDYEIVETEYAHHATEIARQAATANYDIVVAVGGDGSVNDIVTALNGTETKLGIIPCGSGNGLARSLKIPLYTAKALDVLNENKMKRIDTISVNDNISACVAGIGFDALIAKKFKEKENNTRGLHSYLQLIASEYPHYSAHNFDIEIDGERMVKKAIFLIFANANQFGYEAIIAPGSRIDDGLIDVCFIEDMPLIVAPANALLMFAKKIDLSPHVKIIKAKNIIIRNNNFGWVNIDGEALYLGQQLDIKVNHKSLKVIC